MLSTEVSTYYPKAQSIIGHLQKLLDPKHSNYCDMGFLIRNQEMVWSIYHNFDVMRCSVTSTLLAPEARSLRRLSSKLLKNQDGVLQKYRQPPDVLQFRELIRELS